jgi:hypothetical protein
MLESLAHIQRMATTMSRKKLIMLGMVAGSLIGGYLPALFGFDRLMVSLWGSFIGGIVGIWIGYKVSG